MMMKCTNTTKIFIRIEFHTLNVVCHIDSTDSLILILADDQELLKFSLQNSKFLNVNKTFKVVMFIFLEQ